MTGRCNSRAINVYNEIPRLRSEQAPLFCHCEACPFCHCEEPQATWQSRPGSGLSKSYYRAAEIDSGHGFQSL